MEILTTEIYQKGKRIKVPAIAIDGSNLVFTGGLVRWAFIQDEGWLEGQSVDDPDKFIRLIRQSKMKADIFTFSQKLPDTQAKYKYPMEWDNVAAIPINTFEEWWEKSLPQVTRKSVRRAAKRGVTSRETEFNDELVQGIIGVQNDTPVRQGLPNVDYGKDFDVVKEEYSSFLGRSIFIGAYLKDELIGIIKMLHLGDSASIMQIISKPSHYDKRPTNVLITKAVEVCQKKGIKYLIYGKYVYGNKTDSSLTEFKRRNGFEQIDIPKYYIPLTFRGKIAMKLNVHLGLLGILPSGMITFLRNLRSKWYSMKVKNSTLEKEE